MGMVALMRLREFLGGAGHAAAEPLRAWYAEAKAASWAGPHDVKARYPHASLLGQNRLIFNIGGNKYRLVAVIDYVRKGVLIRWLGMHAE